MASKQAGHGWRRRLVHSLIGLAAVCVLAVALCATGWPQRMLLQAVISRATGADVRVGRLLSSLGTLRVSDIEILPNAALAGTESPAPLARISDFDLDYRIWPDDSRYFPSLRVGSVSGDVDLDLLPAPAAPSRLRVTPRQRGDHPLADMLRYVPKDLEIGSIQLKIHGTSRQSAAADLPGEFQGDIEGDAAYKQTPIGVDVKLKVAKAVFENLDLRAPYGRFPVGFKHLDLSGTRVEGPASRELFQFCVPETVLHIAAQALTLGPENDRWYEGDLLIDGHGEAGGAIRFDLDATFNRNQKLQGKLDGTVLDLRAHAGIKDWSRDDVLALVPKNQRVLLANVPRLEGIASAELDARRFVSAGRPQVEAKLTVDPELVTAEGVREPAKLTLTAQRSTAAPSEESHVDLNLQVAGGSLAVAAKAGPTGVQTTIKLDNVDPDRWTKASAGKRFFEGFGSRVGGSLELQTALDLQTVQAVVNLSASPFPFRAINLPEGQAATLTGILTANSHPYWNISGPQLEFRAGDQATATFRNWSLAFDSYAGKADVSSECDLSWIAARLGVDGVQGRISFKGPVSNEHGFLKAAFDSKAQGLGYAGFVLPDDMAVAARGSLSYDNLNGRGGGKDLEMKIGEGTTLTAASWSASGSPRTIEIPYTIQSDLRPLVSLGLLDSVSGSGSGSWSLTYNDTGFQSKMDFSAKADAAVVAGALASLSGVTTAGALVLAGGKCSGTGDMTIAKAFAAGVTLEDIKGPLLFEEGVVKSSSLEATLCGGTTTAEAEVGLLHPGIPVQVTARLKNVDLGPLTRAWAVPTAEMTGLAGGEVTLRMEGGKIQEARASLESHQDFSVNVGLIERLLTSQYVQQMKGKQQVERAVAEIVGREQQRPFDSGQLTLEYHGDRITGQAVLVSEKLDLTVDLAMDAGALVAAIGLLHENQISGVDAGGGQAVQ